MALALAMRQARRPVAVVSLPAEDGRRRRPPAGPALRKVEEVVTSRNHQRIDHPLLRIDFRPHGLCPQRLTVSVFPAPLALPRVGAGHAGGPTGRR
jgi:hypothetical protein